MKVKIFWGKCSRVEEMFNDWAKGKVLNQYVIIHTVPLEPCPSDWDDYVCIAVYYKEGSFWDEPAPEPEIEAGDPCP